MKVMVIVKASNDSEAGQMPSTGLLAAMGKFNEELAAAGILLAAEGLHPSCRGTRVHFSGSKRTVTDGPFTQTKELIAGYWLWRVNSMQEAIDWVKKCPNPMREDSDIEIRRVFEAEDFGTEFTPELREQEAAVGAKILELNPPTFQDGPELSITGLSRKYTLKTRAEIPHQWDEFVAKIADVPGLSGATFYGVSSKADGESKFDYLAGYDSSAAKRSPAGFSTIKLAPSRYAVFAHTGHVSAIPKTVDTIWQKWVPDCAVKVSLSVPWFERYTKEFNPKTGLGGMEFWIPLE